MKTWTIVKFIEENSVAAVPTSWLFGDKQCYWPPVDFPKEKVDRLLKKNEDPSTCWPLFNIKIIGRTYYDDYLKARKKSKQAEDTSDIASDINTDFEKKQRKYRSQRRLSSTSSASENELQVLPSPPPIKRKDSTLKQTVPLLKNSTAEEAENLSQQEEIRVSTFQTKNSQREEITASTSHTKNLKCLCCPVHKNDGYLLRQIMAQQNILKEIILGITDDIEKIAENKRKHLDLDIACDNSLFKKFNFPLKTSEELESDLNIYLENEENYKFAVNEVSRLGGKDVIQFIRRALNILISNELAVQYSWYGKKNNKPFHNLKIANVLIDCLHLQLYRDSKDRYKQGQTKASLSLEHFLGLETGFTLDKESHTVAILCQDVVVVLAFDNRERLMQWQVKLSAHLSDGPHFLVLVSSAPPKSRLPPGPARLHVQERGFCLTTGVPPRVAGQWLISNLRRYGVVEGRFCFEGGSRCIKGEGLYVLLTDQGEEITTTLKAASTGNLHSSRRRPVSRNMSVMDSPRRVPMRATGGVALELSESSLISRADSPYTDMESNYGCGDSISNDGWGPPPIERCMSCISKLGAMSRSSTATVTIGAPCWEHTCDRHSISSSSDSSGWSQAVTKPPARPPKPGSTSPSPKKPAAPPPPSYDNYDIPKIPYPVEPKTDELYDTPRKLKECIQGFGFDTVQKPCGCVVRVRQPEPERPCVCQRLMSCWSATEDVHAVYATVDYTKKTYRQQPPVTTANYANLTPTVSTTTTAATSTNYENMEFAQTLQLYENSREIAEKARALCAKCGHAQDDYLMMEPSNKPSQPHPGYIPMSPAVKQRLGKVLSNSNPNLGPALDRSNKPSGSAMLQANVYQRKQLLDSTDNLDIRRKRSNSADSSTSRCEPEPEPETSPCHCAHAIAVRRSSSVPCKSNRDSSSSNDSGVFELPRRTQICATQTLPRRSKSSDPLRDLSFQFNKADNKSASAEAEVPVCPSGSTSSGTSDMSDYFETLSLSSHSSSDAPPPPSCTLRPRSGNEYLSMQRLIAPVPEERH